MEKLIDEIIGLEWCFFDRVRNEGGRAPCQDDWKTFRIMRSSQFMAWNRPLLESWHGDLLQARERGDNPMTEKYGTGGQPAAGLRRKKGAEPEDH